MARAIQPDILRLFIQTTEYTALQAYLEMVAGNGQVCAMILQLCLATHVFHGMPEVLTHQQNYHIYQRLSAVLAEEVGAPVQHLILQGCHGVGG